MGERPLEPVALVNGETGGLVNRAVDLGMEFEQGPPKKK